MRLSHATTPSALYPKRERRAATSSPHHGIRNHCLVCMTEGRAVQRASQGDNVTSLTQAHDAGVDPRATTDDDMLAKEAHRKNLPFPCRALTFIVDLLQRLRILAGVEGAARASMMLEASPGDISRGPA